MPRFVKGGEPGPGRPKGSSDQGPRIQTLRQIVRLYAREDTRLAKRALREGLRLAAPRNFPYLEFLAKYDMGRPPEFDRDQDRVPLIFFLSRGLPGQFDPLAQAPPGAAQAPPPPRLALGEAKRVDPPPPPPEPEDPDEPVTVRV